MSKPLPFPIAETEVAFTAKPKYKCPITCGIEITATHNVTCLLSTVAAVNFIQHSSIHPSWICLIERKSYPKPQSATRLHINLDVMIFLQLCKGDLRTRVWFGSARHLATNILQGTISFDRLTRGIIPVECKVLSRHSLTFAILTKKLYKKNNTTRKTSITLSQTMETTVI